MLNGTYLLIIMCFLTNLVYGQAPLAANGKFVKVEGRKIYYEETGSGKPLLLLHGFGRTADEWKPFVHGLAKTRRVIAIDLPGHGRSDVFDTSHDYLHKQASQYVSGLINALRLDSIDLIGFSSGAIVSLYLATSRPELVNRMIIVAGHLYFTQTLREFITSLKGPENFINKKEELAVLHGEYKAGMIAEQFWNFRKLYGDPSFTPDILATIKAKTLIVHGDNDPAASVENAFTMYRYIPRAHLWIEPFAEHVGFFLPSLQQEFLRRASDFLTRE